METRIEMRKKDFKKTFDDPRRRREENQVQIRKQNREARLTKRRQQALDGIDVSSPALPLATQADLDKIPGLVQGVMSNDQHQQYLCTQQFRRLLSIERNPPIEQVIHAGVVPRFVEFLRDDDRQELQFEAAWALTNIASGSQEQTRVVIDHGAVPLFVKLLQSIKDEVREQAVWALGNIAGDCPEFRDLVLQCGGLTPLLLQLQHSLNNPSKMTMLRNATWTLSNLFRGKPRPSLSAVSAAMPIIRELIFSIDVEVLTDACWALSYISDGSDDEFFAAVDIILESGVGSRLVQLLGHNSFAVQIPALRTVGNIVSGSELQTQTMILCGCVTALKSLLTAPKKLIRKEACWSLSNITVGNREQIQEVIREGVITQIIDLLPSADYDVKREVNWALANAASGGSQEQIKYLVESRCLPALCEILDWDDEKLLGVILEALDSILRTGEQIKEEKGLELNPYVHLIEEAGALDKLERLQYTQTPKIYELAMKIMMSYFSYDEDPEGGNGLEYEAFTTHTQDGPSAPFDFANSNATMQ